MKSMSYGRNKVVAPFKDCPYNKRTLNEKGTQMKTKLAAVAVIGSMLAAPAFAWGEREQGVLSGIAGLWVLQRLAQPPVVVQQAPMQIPVPQGPMVGQYPTNPVPYSAPYGVFPQCRQILTIQIDRFGNEYRYPQTVCH